MNNISPYVVPGIKSRILTIPEIALKLMREMEIGDISQLRVKSRKEEVRRPRQIMMHLMRWYGHSLTAIGGYFHYDHCTVIHAYRTVFNDCLTDKQLSEFILRMKHTVLVKDEPKKKR